MEVSTARLPVVTAMVSLHPGLGGGGGRGIPGYEAKQWLASSPALPCSAMDCRDCGTS